MGPSSLSMGIYILFGYGPRLSKYGKNIWNIFVDPYVRMSGLKLVLDTRERDSVRLCPVVSGLCPVVSGKVSGKVSDSVR